MLRFSKGLVTLLVLNACSGSQGASSTTGGASPGGTGSNVGGNATQGGAASGGAGGQSSGGSTVAHTPTCPVPAGAEMPEASLPAGYCAWRFAEGLTGPRGIIRDSLGQLLVIEGNSVTLLWDDNGDRINQTTERMRIATVSGLNHGIALYNGFLYASTTTTIYRWPYDGSHTALANRETVLSGMPTGGHSTRTLVFDSSGNLYIAIGSGSNVDSDSSRARVVKLAANLVTSANATLADTTVQGDGTRNEVGLRFDSRGRLWGVENGMDNLSRTDLGGDIHTDNPAEEVNLFDSPGAFYGYPYCWTEGSLPTYGLGPGTQWALDTSTTYTDAWCRNEANVVKPKAVIQAHSAPLDILFYQGGSFPDSMIGNAIITYHGSWNRTQATGYKVVYIPFDSTGMPSGAPTPLLESASAGDTSTDWPHRPVSLAQGTMGEVYVTSDADNIVMAIGHD